jgi:hypothetical protein
MAKHKIPFHKPFYANLTRGERRTFQRWCKNNGIYFEAENALGMKKLWITIRSKIKELQPSQIESPK